jgi:hypothetical protein
MEVFMKKLGLLYLMAILSTLVFAVEPMPYDSAAIKDVMHSNSATVGAVSKAISAGDWNAVAEGFMQFSANAKRALGYSAPKGDNNDWIRIWNDFLSAAYQGVGAAGARDPVAAKKFLDQLTGDRYVGHPEFRG